MANRVKKMKEPKPPKVPKPKKPPKGRLAIQLSNKPKLELRLFNKGMSALHRAGLGGLACTLKAMKRQHQNGLLRDDKLPGPVVDDNYPWNVDETSVTLFFGDPSHAKDYLRKLFAYAFQIRDGVIYLPGQYSDPSPSLAVRAEMQSALTRTFLQGAKKNIRLDTAVPFTVDVEGTGSGGYQIDLQRCNSYVHQSAWDVFVDDASGQLLERPNDSKLNYGSIYPGAMKRHDALNDSDFSDSICGLMSALFYLVGSMALKVVGSGDGVLLIPEVDNLETFCLDRPLMTPQSLPDVRVTGTADASLQAEVRLRANSVIFTGSLTSCRALRFSLRTWTKPQKSRINSSEFNAEEVRRYEPAAKNEHEIRFYQFERALALLPRGFRVRKDESSYWSDSDLRAFIAENLASDRPWYADFRSVFNSVDKRSRFNHQRWGINIMMDDAMLDNEESTVVRSVKSALIQCWEKIETIYQGRDDLIRKKVDDEREKWSRIFAGSPSLTLFRRSLTELYRRGLPENGKANWELQMHWPRVLLMLNKSNWHRTRDLALLGLCCCSFIPKKAN